MQTPICWRSVFTYAGQGVLAKKIEEYGARLAGLAIHRHALSGALRPFVFVCLFFYFAFHAFHGERGLFALLRNQHQISESTTELAAIKHARLQLEKRVSGLRTDGLDLDLLDEQARNMLGLAQKNELLLVWPEDQESLQQ